MNLLRHLVPTSHQEVLTWQQDVKCQCFKHRYCSYAWVAMLGGFVATLGACLPQEHLEPVRDVVKPIFLTVAGLIRVIQCCMISLLNLSSQSGSLCSTIHLPFDCSNLMPLQFSLKWRCHAVVASVSISKSNDLCLFLFVPTHTKLFSLFFHRKKNISYVFC